MIKTRTWIIIICVFLAVTGVISAVLYLRTPEVSPVQILQDGKCIKEIDLSSVKESYEMVIEDSKGGSNTVLVEPGRICIKEADCPDQICVKRGWLFDSSSPIVCLPHRLVIQTSGGSGTDASVDTAAE